MTFSRRTFLQLAASAAAVPMASPFAFARTYPSRPVHLTFGREAENLGTSAAFALCERMSVRLGQKFWLQETRSPKVTTATEWVLKSRPNGSRLLLLSGTHAIIAAGKENLKFDLVRDIAPVAGILRMPLMILVSPFFPAKTVPEFLAYAKANPTKMNYMAGDTTQDLAAEQFKMMTGIDMLRVPATLLDLMGNHVQVKFDYLFLRPQLAELVRDGRLRVLAVTSPTRSSLMPDVPALAEFVPGYETSAWQGVGAPKDTPADIVATLNTAINACLADPEMWTLATGKRPDELRYSGNLARWRSRQRPPISESSSWRTSRSGPK